MDPAVNFIPPQLTPVARKRPTLDGFAVPKFEQPSADGPSMESQGHSRESKSERNHPQPTMSLIPPPLPTSSSFDPANGSARGGVGDLCQNQSPDHELRQLFSLVQGLQDRHHNLIYQISSMQQTIDAGTAKLLAAEQKLGEERATHARAQKNCLELQSLTSTILSKMNNLMLFKSSVEDKNREIDNLIESIKLCKAQMTAKLSEKEKECRKNLEKIIELERRENENMSTIKSQETQFEQEKARLLQDMQLCEERRGAELERLQRATDQIQQLEKALAEAEANYRSALLELDSEFGEYKADVCGIIANFAVHLGCKKPSSFGDKSVAALGVVADELCAELRASQRLLAEESGAKERELQQKYEKLSAALSQETSTRAALEQTAAELHEKCRTLSEELETKAKVIKRLETRIGEQQMECSMKTAKIADMQKLKVMVSVINEVLENEASQMDYEDIRSIFLERMSHTVCQAEAAKLQNDLDACTAERDKLIAERASLSADHARVQESLNGQILALTKELEGLRSALPAAPAGTTAPAKTAIKDNRVDELIDLIERDTQELKTKCTSRPIPSPLLSRERRRNRSASASKFRKRSPVSNHSELDLWAAFAKRP